MTLYDAISRLLTYFPHEEREVPDSPAYPGRNAAALGALNGALQEYHGTGQSWKRRESRGALLRAPATITAIVTHGSDTITIDTPQDWFPGCTIAINGATTDNQLLDSETLLYPHDGPTGPTAATILHDSITLPSDVLSVLSPVRLVDGRPLHPVSSPEQLTLARPRERDYGHHQHVPAFPAPLRKSHTTGTPLFYFIDSHHEHPYADPQFRMLIAPAPAAGMLLTYRVRLGCPEFYEQDYDQHIPAPYGAIDSIILPIAALRLAASPFFNQGAHVEEITRQASLARTELFSMTAQASPGLRIRPGL
jgi:hypothetical protein